MSKFADILMSAARLAILKLLVEANGNQANHAIITSALAQSGIRLSFDQVRGEMAWLEEMRCITQLDTGNFKVATLTEKGFDVARGNSVVPGIDRPVPGAG